MSWVDVFIFSFGGSNLLSRRCYYRGFEERVLNSSWGRSHILIRKKPKTAKNKRYEIISFLELARAHQVESWGDDCAICLDEQEARTWAWAWCKETADVMSYTGDYLGFFKSITASLWQMSFRSDEWMSVKSMAEFLTLVQTYRRESYVRHYGYILK